MSDQRGPRSGPVERLKADHDRGQFSCGRTSLDNYILGDQILIDEERRGAVPYVVCALDDPRRVIGYFTLSAYHITRTSVGSKSQQKRLPGYAEVPASLIGRLAVDQRYQGTGLGRTLLTEAMQRALEATIAVASSVVVVHALDETAASFYRRNGFIPFDDNPLHLYLLMRTVEQMVASDKEPDSRER